MLLKYNHDVLLCPEYIKTSGSGYSTSAVVMKYPFNLPVFTVCPPPPPNPPHFWVWHLNIFIGGNAGVI
jgi:hypothetical protein